jgi:major membrane immunogen (membrane-anchored lipoprotein)
MKLRISTMTTFGLCTAMLLAACGSSSSRDSSTAEGKKYVNALVADFDKDKAKDKTFTRSQIECFSAKIVDAVTVDTMKKNGVTPANAAGDNGLDKLGSKLSNDQVKEISDAFFGGDCFDAAKALASSYASELKNVPKSAPKCLADELVKVDAFKLGTAQQLVGRKASGDSFFPGVTKAQVRDIASKCKIPPDQLGA